MRRFTLLSLPAAFCGLIWSGCADDEDPVVQQAVEIQFDAVVNGQEVACGTDYVGVGSTESGMRIQDFRYFVSDVQLLSSAGEFVPLALEEDGTWQGQNVALLDFEDGTAECSANGNTPTNTSVRGTVPQGDYVGLRFSLGIPEELNHQDTATAPAPFNVGSMFWVWQTGYKFVRIDMLNDLEAPANRWFFHLGSTGCEGTGATAPPTSACTRPNRPTYTFSDFDAQTNNVVMDLGAILENVDIRTDTPESPFGCMSNPADSAECTPVFANMGMDFATGSATACGFDDCQSLFFIE